MIESYENYEWFLKEDLSRYFGKWVAIINKRVVASGDNVSQIIQQIKKEYPNKKPLITRVKNRLSIL